jgi:hypothetical protein
MKHVDTAVLDLGVATPGEARAMIDRLRAEMPSPFYLVAISTAEAPDVVHEEFTTPISDQPRVTLDEAYKAFREIVPGGDFCLLLGCGGETRATCPKAILVDTRILDKASRELRGPR